MDVKIYGIPNCGSVKKARDFFEKNQINYDFHDYKRLGVPQIKLQEWCKQFGWETVLNRKGTTWRKLDETIKMEITDADWAIKLMFDNTSAIKRPIIETNKGNTIGFDENVYEKMFL
jgi:Spx/MgsR family transcriptional regulator